MVLLEDSPADLPTPSGPMRTYTLRPVARGRYPGLVLFSEIFQVTGPIRRTAAMLAGHGFVVTIPEIFHDLLPPGAVLAYDTPGADKGNACKLGRPVKAYDDDARAALAHLAAHPCCTGRLGAFGICIGGHLAFRCAMNPSVAAAACFYATDIHKGSLGSAGDDTLARISRGDIDHCELLLAWGRQDPHISPEGRRLIYDALSGTSGASFQRGAGFQPAIPQPAPVGTSGAGVQPAVSPPRTANFSWLEFNAAHAFLRDEGPRYNPELARQCLGLVADLFRRRLGEGESGGGAVVQAG